MTQAARVPDSGTARPYAYAYAYALIVTISSLTRWPL